MKTLHVSQLPSSILNNHDIMTVIYTFSNIIERNKKKQNVNEIKLNTIMIRKKMEQTRKDYIYKLETGEVHCLFDYYFQLLEKDYSKYFWEMKTEFKNLSRCQCCSRHCFGKPMNIDDFPDDKTFIFNGDRSCHCQCRQTMRFLNRVVYEYHQESSSHESD